VIPAGQDYNLAARITRVRAGAYIDTARPDPGTFPFIHGTASQGSMDEMRHKLQTLVAPYGDAPSEAKPAPIGGLPGLLGSFQDLLKRLFRQG
jgi:hypothetical protein